MILYNSQFKDNEYNGYSLFSVASFVADWYFEKILFVFSVFFFEKKQLSTWRCSKIKTRWEQLNDTQLQMNILIFLILFAHLIYGGKPWSVAANVLDWIL